VGWSLKTIPQNRPSNRPSNYHTKLSRFGLPRGQPHPRPIPYFSGNLRDGFEGPLIGIVGNFLSRGATLHTSSQTEENQSMSLKTVKRIDKQQKHYLRVSVLQKKKEIKNCVKTKYLAGTIGDFSNLRSELLQLKRRLLQQQLGSKSCSAWVGRSRKKEIKNKKFKSKKKSCKFFGGCKVLNKKLADEMRAAEREKKNTAVEKQAWCENLRI